MKNLGFEKTVIKDGFWKFYEDLNRNQIVHSVYERFKETGRFDALKCQWKEGDANKPHIFWDSDVAKWIEGVGYLLKKYPCEELELLVDEMVDDIAKNQREDGYFNSYFLTVNPEGIYRNRGDHELHCTGHLVEAAISYHQATGKDKFLNCMLKNVDCIYRAFVEEKTAKFQTPGHEEIELALLKLYGDLGNEKHLELARFFINQRGKETLDTGITYGQDNLPVRELKEALGHSVRAGYLYTAMAMLSKIDEDRELKAACDRLFENITTKKMSITGGVGAERVDEQFSYEYDLPNGDTYNETCAAIALALFAGELQEAQVDSVYGDLIERIYFNNLLSGVSLSGDRFFYMNPLELDLKKYQRSTFQAACERAKVFECSCCPPNILRMLATIPRYAYTVDGENIYCNQFIPSETKLSINGKDAKIALETNYPVDGELEFTYHGEPATLHIRIPSWCVEYKGKTEKGFAVYSVKDGDVIKISLPMKIHFMEANPNVQDNAGRYAVMRGPIVYCMEGLDNGENLRDISILEQGTHRVVTESMIPAPVLYMDAKRRKMTDELYRIKNDDREFFTARLIPYFSFANRQATDLLVWCMVK